VAINNYADPTREKRDAFDAAKALLAKGDEALLRYAALELRRCIEAIVYEKLKSLHDLLPEASVHTWQVPQAFEALVEIEPNAEEDVTYGIALQSDPDKPSPGPYMNIGTDKRPKAKRVETVWNRLGGYLHAEWPFSKKKTKKPTKEILQPMLEELEPLVNNFFNASMYETISFECCGCGAQVKVLKKAVELNGGAVCLTCGMVFKAENVDGGVQFTSAEPPFTCECGVSTFVATKKMRIGSKFGCRGCKRTFEITGAHWNCEVVADEDGGDGG
jgi:hypothetical protein